MNCRPTYLRMVAKLCGKTYSLPNLKVRCYTTYAGACIKGINDQKIKASLKYQSLHIPQNLQICILQEKYVQLQQWFNELQITLKDAVVFE